MDLDDFIIAVFCWIDEALPQVTDWRRLRQRGPEPVLYESEVQAMEVVGKSLGLSQDSALFAYFRRHYVHFFPRLRRVHRTTFIRQAANRWQLWRIKERLWQQLLTALPLCPTTRSWRFSIACRCPSASLPGPPTAGASAAQRLMARITSSADLLRFPLARPALLARSGHASLRGPSQSGRSRRRADADGGHCWPRRGRSPLLAATLAGHACRQSCGEKACCCWHPSS